MDDQPRDARPSDRSGERRLERPPSERYAAASADEETAAPRSIRRTAAIATSVAILGAIAIAIGGGILAMTAGLLVIAAAIGWGVAAAVGRPAEGAGDGRRRPLAAALAVAGVALGQLGLWLVARQEGGTLGPVDYLGEVFGVLVPLQLLIAGAIAWWRAR